MSVQHGNLSFVIQWKMEISTLKCGSPVCPTWRWCWWTWGLLSSPFSHLKTSNLLSQKAICCECPPVHSSRVLLLVRSLSIVFICVAALFVCAGVTHALGVIVPVKRNREASLRPTTTTSWRWDAIRLWARCRVSHKARRCFAGIVARWLDPSSSLSAVPAFVHGSLSAGVLWRRAALAADRAGKSEPGHEPRPADQRGARHSAV